MEADDPESSVGQHAKEHRYLEVINDDIPYQRPDKAIEREPENANEESDVAQDHPNVASPGHGQQQEAIVGPWTEEHLHHLQNLGPSRRLWNEKSANTDCKAKYRN